MPQSFTILVATLLGAFVGSFLNVIILRVPKGRRVVGVRNRSQCPRCRHTLHARDLVPVLSFVALRGKCRYCRAPISWQYPLVELLTAALFGAIAWQYGVTMVGWIGVIGAAWFIVLGVIDGKHGIVPDRVSVPALVVIGILQLARVADFGKASLSTDVARDALAYLLAAGIGAAWFAVQWVVSRGRWVGTGDIRLGALMGLYLGMPHTIIALFLAYVIGSAWAVVLLVRKRVTLKSAIPFGTFLAAASILCFLFRPAVVSWYQRTLGW